MIDDFFEYEGWDELDIMGICLYEVTLLRPVGPYGIGSVFTSVAVDFNTGELILYLGETIAYKCTMRIELNAPA